jgi:ribonuclease-3
MEYLGDAVLQLLVTEEQYGEADKPDEGKMTKRRQQLVCEQSLLAEVERMGIAEHLLACGKEDNIGAKTLSSLYESVLAAVYLDGGYEAAKKFFKAHKVSGAQKNGNAKQENYKGALQEYLQGKGYPKPEYAFLEKTGADNTPTFRMKVSALGKTGEGLGASKREAQQQAAKALLEQLI